MFNITLDQNIFHSNWSYFLTLERNNGKNLASLIVRSLDYVYVADLNMKLELKLTKLWISLK